MGIVNLWGTETLLRDIWKVWSEILRIIKWI